MKYTSRITSLFALILAAGPAFAGTGLQAAGPIDPVTTLPSYYMDNGGVAPAPFAAGLPMTLCDDARPINPTVAGASMCVLTPEFDPNPAINPGGPCTTPRPPGGQGVPLNCFNAVTTTGPINDFNFPVEIFYFLADSKTLNAGPAGASRLTVRLAVEAAWLPNGNGPTIVPGQGTTFARVLMKRVSNLSPNSTYTVQHPYGQFTFQTDATGSSIITNGQTFRAQDPVAPAPGLYFPVDMQTLPNTGEGPFLVATTGFINIPTGCVTGAVGCSTFLGDPLGAGVTVTGSPIGRNSITFSGPNVGGAGINTLTTNLFTLSGKVFTAPIPSPMSIDKQTYSRDATSARADVFVTAKPTAVVSAAGAGIVATTLTQNVPNSGKFFASIPFTPVGTLPTISLTNSLDVPPILYPLTLVDGIDVTQVDYNPTTKNLLVKAASRDKLAASTLTVVDPLDPLATVLGTLAAGSATISFTAAAIPPINIQVKSTLGGSAIVPVRVAIAGAAPVAVNDTVSTPSGTAVVVDVLANDTSANGIVPSTVTIVTAPTAAMGTAAVSPVTGAITFTPAVGFAGAATFTYTVKDTLNLVSNVATVTVNVGVAPLALENSSFDFNGDGKADILWRNTTTGQVFGWLMNGATPLTIGALPTVADPAWQIVGSGDFDGDGKADIVWYNTTTGDVYVWLANGLNILSFNFVGNVPPSGGWTIAKIGDYNGDGKADILWRNTLSGDVYLWLMNGTTLLSAQSLGNVPTSWQIMK